MEFSMDTDDNLSYSVKNESEARKRLRSSNFTSQEKNVLIHIIEKYQDVVECKKTDKASFQEREKIWEIITQEYNDTLLSEPIRTCRQLKMCYDNLKRKIRRESVESKTQKPSSGTIAISGSQILVLSDVDSNSSTPVANSQALECKEKQKCFREAVSKRQQNGSNSSIPEIPRKFEKDLHFSESSLMPCSSQVSNLHTQDAASDESLSVLEHISYKEFDIPSRVTHTISSPQISLHIEPELSTTATAIQTNYPQCPDRLPVQSMFSERNTTKHKRKETTISSCSVTAKQLETRGPICISQKEDAMTHPFLSMAKTVTKFPHLQIKAKRIVLNVIIECSSGANPELQSPIFINAASNDNFSTETFHEPRRKGGNIAKLKKILLDKEIRLVNLDLEMRAKKYELELKVEEAKLEYYRRKIASLDSSSTDD